MVAAPEDQAFAASLCGELPGFNVELCAAKEPLPSGKNEATRERAPESVVGFSAVVAIPVLSAAFLSDPTCRQAMEQAFPSQPHPTVTQHVHQALYSADKRMADREDQEVDFSNKLCPYRCHPRAKYFRSPSPPPSPACTPRGPHSPRMAARQA